PDPCRARNLSTSDPNDELNRAGHDRRSDRDCHDCPGNDYRGSRPIELTLRRAKQAPKSSQQKMKRPVCFGSSSRYLLSFACLATAVPLPECAKKLSVL